MKFVSYLITTVLFVAILGLAPGIVHDSLADQQAKSQIATINHIMYGIFNVDAWKQQITQVLISEIGRFDLKTTAEKLKGTIEDELNAVIDKLNEQIKESNKGSLGGKIKQALINLVVNVQKIKEGTPKYADAIIDQLGKPENQQKIKALATKQLKTYLKKSYTDQDMQPVQAVLDQTGMADVASATAKLYNDIEIHRESLEVRCYWLMGLAALLFAWAYFPLNRNGYTFATLFVTCVALLGIGVSIPMIDLEAKISELSFVILGHKIIFTNQILYFQSKSVLNVFWLMITHHDIKMKLVGVLLVTFSIVFPTLKLAASIFYHYFGKRGRVVEFFAFKIGKWSMADVMVIAILMGYIGFNGIIETQFNKMKEAVPQDVTLFTTNGTTLLMGYYIFIAYVLLAMVLSSYVHSAGLAKSGLDASKGRPQA